MHMGAKYYSSYFKLNIVLLAATRMENKGHQIHFETRKFIELPLRSKEPTDTHKFFFLLFFFFFF